MDRVQEFESLLRGDSWFSRAVVDIPPDEWPTIDVGWIMRLCRQVPPSTNNNTTTRKYATFICPHLRRIVFSIKREEFDHRDALEPRDTLLLWEAMNTTIEMCGSRASRGAVESLELVLGVGDGIGGSGLADSWGARGGVRIAFDEHLECLGPVVGRELGVIEEDCQVLQFIASVGAWKHRKGDFIQRIFPRHPP